jgi:hypothetical protein
LTNMSAALSVASHTRPSTPQPESCICTLFEGDYHFGVAAFVNSIVRSGFKGEIFAGYRGELPTWACAHKTARDSTILVDAGVTLTFLKVQTTWHLTNYKPIFMQQIIAQRTAHPGVLFYFDPDITVRAPWSFFVEWAQNGIAVCEDVNSPMPASHPRRLKWRKLFPDLEFDDRIAPCYVNGGFVGLAYEWRRFLDLWAEIISRAGEYTGGPDKWYALKPPRPEQPFSAFDQDALNVALMTSSMPFSIIGQDGMDFGPIGYLMSHAIGPRKPWHGGFALNALKGVRPSIADRQYMHNIDGPLLALSLAQRALSRGDLAIGKLLGRILA